MPTATRADPSRRAWPIFALAVAIGIGALVPFALQAYRDIRITWFYRAATCQIISSSIYSTDTRSRQNVIRRTAHPEFTYQLNVGGRWYTSIGFDNMKGRTAHPGEVDSFTRGQSYPCWYDPWNPAEAVLQRQVYKPFYIGLLIPLAFLFIGGSFLTKSLRPAAAVTLTGVDKGEALAVRLRPELTAMGATGCLGAAAIVGTAGVVALFAFLIRSDRLNSGDGLTTVAVIVAAIDAFIIYHLIRTIRSLGIPEPIVEIDHEPLRPGDSARLFIRQTGPARFDAFKVAVTCEEQGQKGTRRSHTRQLVSKKGVEIAMAGDLTESLTIEIPRDARASLKELQTIINWKILVQRKSSFGNNDREFVFRVLRDESDGDFTAKDETS